MTSLATDRPSRTARRSGTLGPALIVASAGSNQTGASLGALAFPVLGPVGVVAVRQVLTALVLLPTVRPRWRSLSRGDWARVVGLALVFSSMNLTLYAAIDRIGLALAVTLEFLGPLAVAAFGSRHLKDVMAVVLAGLGVLLISSPGPSTDLLGIGLGLVAGASWGSYILLNRSLASRLPGVAGTAAASGVAAMVWLPVGALWFAHHPPTPAALALAVACGLLSSVVPYVLDLVALRRVPAYLYGTLSSVHLVWAALLGWVALGQELTATEWLGIVVVVTSNVIVSLRPRAGRPSRPADEPAAP